jgi:KDO2-lipid IV(A) lauroyltransferase
MLFSLIWRVVYAGIFCVSLLPLSVLYIAAYPFYLILNYVLKYRYKIISDNLLNAFPEKSKSELNTITKAYYRYLTMLFCEVIKGVSISKNQLQKRVNLVNPEMLAHYNEQKKPVIVLLGHHGNWEMIALASTLVAPQPFFIVYKPLKSKLANQIFKKIRQRQGATLVPMNDTYDALIQNKHNAAVFTLVADQNPSNIKNAFWVPFLNQNTVFLSGPEILAKKLKYPILYLSVNCYKSGYYNIETKVILEENTPFDSGDITRKYAALLEEDIINKPHFWLWSHKRWKHKQLTNKRL